MTTPQEQQLVEDAAMFQGWARRAKLTTQAFRHLLLVATRMVIDTLTESPRFRNWLRAVVGIDLGLDTDDPEDTATLEHRLRRRIRATIPRDQLWTDQQLRRLIRQVLLEEGVIQLSNEEMLAEASQRLQAAIDAGYNLVVTAAVQIDGEVDPIVPFDCAVRKIAIDHMSVEDALIWLQARGYLTMRAAAPADPQPGDLELPTFLRSRMPEGLGPTG